MMSSKFSCKTSGKWILCGEHAVIRGHPAIVFPFKQKQLTLNFEASNKPLSATFLGSAGEDLHLLFWSVIAEAFKLLQKNMQDVTGHIQIENNVPIGTGLGASAALSVAVSRWLISLGLLEKSECFQYSKQLEHLFHKKSSGLDIAGSMSDSAIQFQNGEITSINLSWSPLLYLSFSGPVGITSHCVKKVESQLQQAPTTGQKLDLQMAESAKLAYQALTNAQGNENIHQLKQAIELANDCFHQWGLCNADMQKHMDWLQDNGAITVKPTGSGSGGYTLSLWEAEPPIEIQDKLVRAC